MENKFYILEDGNSVFSAAVQQRLLFKEFAIHLATLAGLTEAQAESSQDKGGIFLRADTDFVPYELAKALHGLKQENVALHTADGEILGYALSTPLSQYTAQTLADLPKVTVRKSKRLTSDNYADILRMRQDDLRLAFGANGVFFESEEITISPLYDIEPNTFIGRGTYLGGRGKIGSGSMLIGACQLTDVTLGEGVTVNNSVLLECTASDGTTVGPFAYLRPGTVVGKKARIGDFVEIKNSVIDDGTKVSHLTYIGDSDVGKGVNFGCGTVTSNYDGSKKFRTRIGDHAFIGCNTNLVAPVSVGDNAYIAAGSTVTEDIPDGALAIARQRQTNKENWVQKNKPELIK